MKNPLLTTVFLLAALFCFAQSGSVTVTSVQQRSDGSGLVDVFYNLSGTESSFFVNMRVSFDAGQTYSAIRFNTMSGHTGPVSPGSNRQIVWNPTLDYSHRFSPQTKLKVVAYVLGISNPCPGQPTVEDIDGNLYHTIQFGSQCWMASNLNVTRKPNGQTLTRYCYNNDPTYCEQYGGLYDWATVMNGAGSSGSNPSGVRGICPAGWHVPSDAEWTQLTTYLIDSYVDITSSNVGNKLKSCRQVSSPIGSDCNTSEHPRWNSNASHYGTNDFGFSALPAGRRNSVGSFNNLGSYGYWWSSTESSSTYAWYRLMYSSFGGVTRLSNYKTGSFSVRCLKD
jgi:uncharacterized protein (TIGR02145 family)